MAPRFRLVSNVCSQVTRLDQSRTPTVAELFAGVGLAHMGLESLPDGFGAECVEAAERGEAGRGEGSVEHVEVFQMVV